MRGQYRIANRGIARRPTRRPARRVQRATGDVSAIASEHVVALSVLTVFATVSALVSLVAIAFALDTAVSYFVVGVVILTTPAWGPFLIVRSVVAVLDR